MKSVYARLPVSGHYLQKRLKLAGFAWRLAGFSILLIIAAVLFYRLGSIVPQALIGLLLLAAGLSFMAFGIALYGMARAWFQGVAGGGTAVGAFVLSVVALAPFGVAAYFAQINPPTNVAMTQRLSPDDVAAVIDALADSGTPGAADVMLRNQPSIVPGRRYLAEAPRVYRAARTVLDDLGWTVDDVEAGDAAADGAGEPAESARGDLGISGTVDIPIPTPRASIDAAEADDPDLVLESDQYRLAVVARDRLFALPSDMAIRIVQEGDESFVDLLSTSRSTGVDLGQNRRFIERFLADLDTAMSGLETLDTAGG